MNERIVKNGLILAALMNFSVIIFSKGFTNEAINNADPTVMSNFGLLMIVLWGLAYISATTVIPNIKWIAAVFSLEKLVYVVVWGMWFVGNSLESVYSEDTMAGIFYSVYGLNDFVFLMFFIWVFIKSGAKGGRGVK